jgi:DNA-directed RNA polymerases I, II, and III subunit RPABC2
MTSSHAPPLGGPAEKQTTKFATKYEKSRLIGARATAISAGAPITIDLAELRKRDPDRYTDPLVIAEEELRQKKMPIVVKRHQTDGTKEDWDVNELVFE